MLQKNKQKKKTLYKEIKLIFTWIFSVLHYLKTADSSEFGASSGIGCVSVSVRSGFSLRGVSSHSLMTQLKYNVWSLLKASTKGAINSGIMTLKQ